MMITLIQIDAILSCWPVYEVPAIVWDLVYRRGSCT